MLPKETHITTICREHKRNVGAIINRPHFEEIA